MVVSNQRQRICTEINTGKKNKIKWYGFGIVPARQKGGYEIRYYLLGSPQRPLYLVLFQDAAQAEGGSPTAWRNFTVGSQQNRHLVAIVG